jgi:hypothetical protein
MKWNEKNRWISDVRDSATVKYFKALTFFLWKILYYVKLSVRLSERKIPEHE